MVQVTTSLTRADPVGLTAAVGGPIDKKFGRLHLGLAKKSRSLS
jgi:hypothetical protein